MKEINWGFIGCGEVTEKKSGPAFNSVPGSRVVAVMSRTKDHAKAYAQRHGVKRWYTDAGELINDDEVNAVYIATPPSSHATYAIMAMHAMKPVYIEKPLAASYDDCIRINRVSQQTQMPCYVAYYRRYLPYFQKIKQLIEERAIGNILNIQIRFSWPPRKEDFIKDNLPWRLRPEISGGGYFYDLAPHQLDLLQDIFGVITEASGICANRGGLYEAEDSVSACFLFESGVPASGSWCFVGHSSAQEDRIDVLGDRGTISFSVYNYEPIQLKTSMGTTLLKVENPPYAQLPIIKSVVEALQGTGVCSATSVAVTPVNWAIDRILGKF